MKNIDFYELGKKYANDLIDEIDLKASEIYSNYGKDEWSIFVAGITEAFMTKLEYGFEATQNELTEDIARRIDVNGSIGGRAL